ncbi:MAG: flagellar motor switch phosphatase FliY [Actinobacteria bacterium]|nr:flagellar motor switch phosphatase FliY [Actinomycetota bacterium]
MADESLSQEEIDRLLRKSQGGGEGGIAEEDAAAPEAAAPDAAPGVSIPDVSEVLSVDQADTLGEFYNIAMGKAATVLSSILGRAVDITTPVVSVETWKSLRDKHPVPSLLVMIEYTQGLEGTNVLVVTQRDANIIANIMDEEEADLDQPLDEYRQGVVGEAMNQMIGGAVVSIAEMLGREVTISPPNLFLLDMKEDTPDVNSPFDEGPLVQIAFSFEVEELVHSEMLQVMSLDFAKSLADEVMEEEEEATVPASGARSEEHGSSPVESGLEEAAEPPVQVKRAEFQPVRGDNGDGSHEDENLEIIMDIEVEVTVELGRTRMKIKDVLALGEGSVVELDKLVGEPMDIYANDKLIARGEVVVIEEDFGVRITEIVKGRSLQGSLN